MKHEVLELNIEILEPHGFCMGVKAAIDAALRALSASSAGEGARQVYCLHELVHNAGVVADLRARGMVFVESLAEIPEGARATVLFSAHGVAPEVRREAARRGLRTIDATCPFVARVHRQVRADAARGRTVVVVGHAAHVEVRGVVAEARDAGADVHVVATAADGTALPLPPETPLGVVCQTTLAADEGTAVVAALRARFADVATTAAAAVCTATRDRQEAVRRFVADGGDGVLVLGSAQSANTRRLAEIAARGGARVWRAGTMEELATCDFAGVRRLGVTSGASTPESFFAAAVAVVRPSRNQLG